MNQETTPVETQEVEQDGFMWTALEHEDREHSRDWFWLVGIIVISGAVISIIRDNLLFAIFLVLAGAVMFMQRLRPSREIQYLLDEKGLYIDTKLYLYENIKKFWIDTETRTLLIEIDRLMMPLSTIPIPEEAMDDMRFFLSHFVEESKLTEPISHKIMEKIGL